MEKETNADGGEYGQSLSPLWHQALERYRDELQAVEDYRAIQQVHTLEDLIDSFTSIQGAAPSNYASLLTLNKIAPRLKFVDDLSAVLALCVGVDTAVTAAVWGSIRLILSHASSAAETLKDVLDMIEELSLTLPRLQAYERTKPLSRSLQEALMDVYCEIICFYARSIHFLRSNPHLVLRKNAWQSFRGDFARTNMRVKRMSSTVESEVDMARMRKDGTQYKEVLELLQAMKLKEAEHSKPSWHHNIPFAANAKFSGREDVLSTIGEALSPQAAAPTLKSIALFGMGGVGKTQLGIQYAYRNLDKFDVVLWIAADNAITIGQSCRTIADKLGLLEGKEEAKDTATAIYQVKSWMSSTKLTWLAVFDNADNLTALKTAWPGAVRGSVILTTRDFIVATSLATQYVQVDPLGNEEGCRMLLKSLDLEQASPDDEEVATTIVKTLGGLPLALTQVGGFVKQRRMSLKEFLPLYGRHSAKIDARKAPGSDYEYTLNTVWDVSFDKLPQMSTTLLNLLSFFDPDGISEDVLLQGSEGIDDEYAFLSDEMEYLYEREIYSVSKDMVKQAILTFKDKASLEYASAIDLGGLISLDLAEPAEALESFQRALEIRRDKLGPENPFIAYSLNNVALAYTEMEELDLAFTAHQEAMRLRLEANSDRIGNTYSNFSSLLLRMGRPDAAEEMLSRCPSLKDFTDETFLATGNPRFSGDMVLLSRIRRAQGRHVDALRLASKALAFRRKLLGNLLKTWDSQYDVASMLLDDGHVSTAIQLFQEIVRISETFVEGDGQRARALYKLTNIYADKGMQAESVACREKALALRATTNPKLKDAPFEEQEFSKLCLWMLW